MEKFGAKCCPSGSCGDEEGAGETRPGHEEEGEEEGEAREAKQHQHVSLIQPKHAQTLNNHVSSGVLSERPHISEQVQNQLSSWFHTFPTGAGTGALLLELVYTC